jgi:hypothetical protein
MVKSFNSFLVFTYRHSVITFDQMNSLFNVHILSSYTSHKKEVILPLDYKFK